MKGSSAYLLTLRHGQFCPRAPVRLALKAAQASLSKGLTRLWVATTARSLALLTGEGESLARGVRFLPGGMGEAIGGGLSSLFFPGGLGSGNPPHPILPPASTGDSFTVILGLEGQVTSPLSSTQGEAYNRRFGILQGELSGR